MIETQGSHSLVHSRMPTATGSALNCIWKLNLGLLCGLQGDNYLSYHLLLPRVCVSRKPDWKQMELQSSHSQMGCRLPKWHLNHCGKCLLFQCWNTPRHSDRRQGLFNQGLNHYVNSLNLSWLLTKTAKTRL